MEEELEKIRKKALMKLLISIFSIIAVGSIIYIIFDMLEIAFFILLIFGAIIIGFFISKKDLDSLKEKYKNGIVLETLNSVFTDVKFDYENGISKEVLKNTNMIDTGDEYSSNDHVIGKYKNINFELSDIHIKDVYYDSDGHRRETTIFKGQWYIFDFNKNFKSDLQVREKNFYHAKRGKLFGEKLKKVELEDVDFNKKFHVYAKDPLESFYILTPNTMEKIKEIQEHIKGSLLLCFINNKLHIALNNNKDFFEVSVFKKINLAKDKQKVETEIKHITDFVDILDLDNNLFKKGGI